MQLRNINVALLALLLADLVLIPIVSADEKIFTDSAIKNAEAAYQKEKILASFGQISEEKSLLLI